MLLLSSLVFKYRQYSDLGQYNKFFCWLQLVIAFMRFFKWETCVHTLLKTLMTQLEGKEYILERYDFD